MEGENKMTQIDDLQCPSCGNDNAMLIECSNHRREQMNCFCNVCAHSWVEKFVGVVKEAIISGRKAS